METVCTVKKLGKDVTKSTKSVSFERKSDIIEKKVPLHPPASDAPVCANVTSEASVSCAPRKTEKDLSINVENDFSLLTDVEIATLVYENKIKDHTLEKRFNPTRAVSIRRLVFERKLASLGYSGALDQLPSTAPECDNFYDRIHGANCEIVVGYVPLPVGIVGPLTLNG